jgi:hypothetical protein
MNSVDAFWSRMQGCALTLGRELGPVQDRYLPRLVERDADLVEHGFDTGLLRITGGRNVTTADPFQATAWLVEGNPVHLCWEYLPHMAAYVELLVEHGYPSTAVRFETPDAELRLDLAALRSTGEVLVLGEVKVDAKQLMSLERVVTTFIGDPGEPLPVKQGGPQGAQREGWKLAHQLWVTRAPYLWLVAAGTRAVFRVRYGESIELEQTQDLPSVVELWPDGPPATTPRLRLATAM